MDLGYGQGSRDREERISPREGELIKYRDMRTVVVFHLSDGGMIEGAIRWYDHQSVRLIRTDRSEITLFNHAVTFYHAKNPGE